MPRTTPITLSFSEAQLLDFIRRESRVDGYAVVSLKTATFTTDTLIRLISRGLIVPGKFNSGIYSDSTDLRYQWLGDWSASPHLRPVRLSNRASSCPWRTN